MRRAAVVPASMSLLPSRPAAQDLDEIRQAGGCPGCTFRLGGFRSADLHGADFAEARLIEADFKYARLDAAGFAEVWLQRAQFERASPVGAGFEGAGMRGADLEKADALRARFDEADLRDPDLANAGIAGARFVEADLRAALLRRVAGAGAVFREAPMDRVDLERVQLSGTDLSGATLQGANLEDAHMRRTRLPDADLQEARGLEQEQLATACGGSETRLPRRLSVEMCGASEPEEADCGWRGPSGNFGRVAAFATALARRWPQVQSADAESFRQKSEDNNVQSAADRL